MKKFIVIAAALFVGIQANAQLIFNGGYLHATEKSTFNVDNSTYEGIDLLDGFYAGAKYRFSLEGITQGLSVAPGANVSFLFGRHNEIASNIPSQSDPFDDKAFMQQIAINVPVHIQYLLELTPDFKIEFWAGPTAQYGLYDRVIDGTDNPTLIYNQYKVIPSLLGLNREVAARSKFNLYLGLGAGIEVSELIHVNVGYDFGLINLSTKTNDKLTRNLLRIGLGYNF